LSECSRVGAIEPAVEEVRRAGRLEWLRCAWPLWAAEKQRAPAGDWATWLILGGRGAGKTRAGAEWVRACALGTGGPAVGRIALVGETHLAARDVMIEGESGLLAIHPRAERPAWNAGRRRLEWPNGAVAQTFSAEDPDGLRGPQFGAAWCDELAKWRHAEATWDMLQFGLRLGARPRQVVTTTPRPLPLLKRLLGDAGVAVTRMASRENAAHLAPGFIDALEARYGGTRLGRQELEGELVEDRPDALWSRAELEALRVVTTPPLTRIVVAVDPPASSGPGADKCGIVAAGLTSDGEAVVLADETLAEARPERWAARAIGLYHRLGADRMVAEINQGGEMVAAVIRAADPMVALGTVRATRGKWVRAEPVAALYARGKVRHAGAFTGLEDEMCDFGVDGLSSGRSPDRLDALVWALTELMLKGGAEPRVRGL